MKILVVLINSGNYVSRYVLRLILKINQINRTEKTGVSADWVSLVDYMAKNQDEYDVLIYNTFPDETCPVKFAKELTAQCDKKFNTFKGMKILLDTHDNGTRDGFVRFNDLTFPRIKVNPSYEMIGRMNLVITIPYIVYPIYNYPAVDRPYKLVCAMRTRNMPVTRLKIFDAIKQFNPIGGHINITEHARRLRQTWINVVSTGNGDSSLSHVDTLAAGALLLAEENIKRIKILPYADLEDGVNFVSYNLENVVEKLTDLMGHPDKVDSIRANGLKTFTIGYDILRNARQLVTWIINNK